MAKVLLVHPWNFHEEGINYTPKQLQQIWRNAPLGLVLLATELQNAGHDVKICDLERNLIVNGGDIDQALMQLKNLIENETPDFIGITILSIRYIEAQRIINLCNEIRQNATKSFKIVAGNIHSSSEPELTFNENPALDAIFIGEADDPFKKFIEGVSLEKIQGVAYRQGDRIIQNSEWLVSDLDALPFPNWNFIDTQFYAAPNFSAHGRKDKPARSLDIITSRGCVYHCSFCVYNKARYRCNSPEYVIGNIEFMLSSFDIDSIYFLDSSLGNNRRQLVSICEILIEKGLNSKFKWSANMRSNQVDEDILKLMWKAGCRKLLYGFESGSQRILDLMKKKCTVEQNSTAAKLHKKLGFPYHASMIMGFPGETVKDLKLTLNWLKKNRPPVVGINTYVPLPGSEDYLKLKSEGKIKVQDPNIWRLLGEVNNKESQIFSDVPTEIFWKYYEKMQALSMEFRDKENKYFKE